MAAATTTSSAFHLFSHLPLELRTQVWRYALPSNVSSPFYFYKEGCWELRALTRSDPYYDYQHDSEALNRVQEFRHNLIDPIKFDVPLIFASREARGIAIAWALENGIRNHDGQSTVLERPFDPERDTLYVPLSQFENYLSEPCGRMFELNMNDRHYRTTNLVT